MCLSADKVFMLEDKVMKQLELFPEEDPEEDITFIEAVKEDPIQALVIIGSFLFIVIYSLY